MEYEKSFWNGYERLDFVFEGRKCILVLPKNPDPQRRWIYKTEYFTAFPTFELEMLSRGWYLAHMENITRWHVPEDTDARPRFCKFLKKEFGLHEKCFPVGMSCGGMQAIYFASRYPQYVAAMYLDAPVVNLLSCPCGVGISHNDPTHLRLYAEFVEKTGKTVSDLINYRDHPYDHISNMIDHRIPVFLVCGDADITVPYPENGACLTQAYRESDVPFMEILKPGCRHHPHGLEDPSPIAAFAERYYK